MNKKILAAGLVIGSLGWIIPVLAAVKSPFPDIAVNSEHLAAISFLKEKGIISGYQDGSFKPLKTINRAEALKLVFLTKQALGQSDSGGSASALNFPDVKNSDWFAPYVEKATRLGIVKGYEDGTFMPANEITAAESLKVIYTGLIANFSTGSVSEKPFTDVTLDKWYAPYLEYGKKQQYIEANVDGTYLPERAMSREDFAEAIYRVAYTQANQLNVFPLNQNWPSCNNYQVGYRIKHPFNWEIVPAGDQIVFWRKDELNGQVSFARVYPNSGVAVVAVDANPKQLSLDQYMQQIEYGSGSNKQTVTLNGLPFASVYIEQSGLQDNYFQLPNGKILVIYAQIGDGTLNWELKQELRYMLASVRESSIAVEGEASCLGLAASTGTSNVVDTIGAGGTVATMVGRVDQVKADVLKLVLADRKSGEALSKINDELLIDTDSIGIGMGPVDYYYSDELKLTLKIDRTSSTILATKEGKSSAF